MDTTDLQNPRPSEETTRKGCLQHHATSQEAAKQQPKIKHAVKLGTPSPQGSLPLPHGLAAFGASSSFYFSTLLPDSKRLGSCFPPKYQEGDATGTQGYVGMPCWYTRQPQSLLLLLSTRQCSLGLAFYLSTVSTGAIS